MTETEVVVAKQGFQLGDDVYVLFWRPRPHPNDPGGGEWDRIVGRVILATEKLVLYEIGNPSLPYGSDGHIPLGSTLRFAEPKYCFSDLEEAVKLTKEWPRPEWSLRR